MVFHRGKDLPVFDTSIGKIGPIICKDLLYPESVRVLALKGAEIITFSTAWSMDPRTDQTGYMYDLLGRANALMNGVWMVMSNQVFGSERSKHRCYGHSRVISPRGKIIAGIGNIYSDEVLFHAKIHPKTKINKISDSKLKEIFEAIKEVLKLGIKKRGILPLNVFPHFFVFTNTVDKIADYP